MSKNLTWTIQHKNLLTGDWVEFGPKFTHMRHEFAEGAWEMFNTLYGHTGDEFRMVKDPAESNVGYVVWQDFDSVSKSCHARSFADMDEAIEYRCQLIDMVSGLLRITHIEEKARKNFAREFEMWAWFRAAESIKSGTSRFEAIAILADAAVRMEKFSEI